MRRILLAAAVVALLLSSCSHAPEYDICVYGGTSAGVIAAESARRLGKTVILIEPGQRLGGLSSGGLGATDIGNKQAVTGLSKDFYRRLGAHYGSLERWIFEPSAAEAIFESYVEGIEVLRGYRITGADMQDGIIGKISLESSDGSSPQRDVTAKMFIDCTYEGDLMVKAGVSYTVGREDNSLYNETWNGAHIRHTHQFPDGVDPYKVPGDPSGGLLWGIGDGTDLPIGAGDASVQAYNYRICLTDVPENMIPISRPDDYDPSRYELMLRLFEAQPDKRSLNHYFAWTPMPGRKTDINNNGAFSTDMIGMNYNYPEASYAEREAIIEAHKTYTQGMLWFVGNDERVPQELREQILKWGYPKDEFVETGNWTPQLYIREARRMVSDYVMTQADCENRTEVKDGVGMAAYTMDSHNCRRIVIEKDGVKMVKNEGDVQIGGGLPYPVSYRSIIPARGECRNLLVPVCLSASHIAFGSIRMEPVFMVLAQSAAVAASMAIASGDVHQVDVNELQRILVEDPLLDGTPAEILIDDIALDATALAGWEQMVRRGGYGSSYLVRTESQATVRFALSGAGQGRYNVYTYCHRPTQNTAPQTVYSLFNGKDTMQKTLVRDDIRIEGQTSGDWFLLGEFDFTGDQAWIDVSSPDAGALVADAMLLVPAK
ncbi:MAG: FAD-dependent oxidoreductase [Tannerellaceae bacterium]|jgi:hypothetical protein|nr:FAD-dependent oxidoreductase [Tannerellaceae bacterium]